jgi:hypothetical protein
MGPIHHARTMVTNQLKLHNNTEEQIFQATHLIIYKQPRLWLEMNVPCLKTKPVDLSIVSAQIN